MSFKFLELFQGVIQFRGNFIEIVENEDLQELSKDYSISFWINIHKILKGRQVTVYHKGDNGTSQPTISLHERDLLISFDTVRGGNERLFATVEIPLKAWTHIAFTIFHKQYTEASLYINGRLDTSISLNIDIAHNTGNCYVGKDPWNHGFIGEIGEPLLFFTTLSPDDIWRMYQQSIENWNQSQCFRSSQFFYERKSRASTPGKWFRDNESSRIYEEGESIRTCDSSMMALSKYEKLEEFFQKNPTIYRKVSEIANSQNWLTVIFNILNIAAPQNGKSAQNKIEADRKIPPTVNLNINFTKKELIALAKVLRSPPYEKSPIKKSH
ncbi:unnamed protein product [Blepharisma stoltei]|uniref:LamG domain-containing protein n=1 Tax=Blepharisma stoltei TaxID=1481888 RepID=A0AAU9K904_9CILI|nr:unnamed protein product [Blepharisma stoltei]